MTTEPSAATISVRSLGLDPQGVRCQNTRRTIMAVVRRWNSRPFSQTGVSYVPDVVGVYALLTSNGYVNYVGVAASLGQALSRHLTVGDVPAANFIAWQTNSRVAAQALARQKILEFEPYYNVQAF